MTKLRIDLLNGTLEVEGEESFVTTIYNDFKERLSQESVAVSKAAQTKRVTATDTEFTKKSSMKRKRSGLRAESHTVTPGLKLEGLREFFKEKGPKNGFENNAVFVYFLQKKMKKDQVSLDDVFTCYKTVGIRVPRALRQSLADTASRKSTINTSNIADITLTTVGENEVEHDLPHKTDKK